MSQKKKLIHKINNYCAQELQQKIIEQKPEKTIFFKPKLNNVSLIGNKILIICYDALGDFILTTPALLQIKKLFLTYEIDLLISPRNYELAQAYNEFNKLWSLDLNSVNSENYPSPLTIKETETLSLIQSTNYSLIINLFNKPNLTALYKISKLLGSNSIYITADYLPKEDSQVQFLKNIQSDLFVENKTIHFIDQMLEVVSKINQFIQPNHRIQPVSKIPILPTLALASSNKVSSAYPQVIFNPFGSQKGNSLSRLKTWFILRALLKESKFEVTLFSSTASRLFLLPKSPMLKVRESHSIIDALKIIYEMDLVLTTDTSIMHIATGMNKKLIVLKNNETWRSQFDPLFGNFKIISSSSKNISKVSIPKIKNAITELMAF